MLLSRFCLNAQGRKEDKFRSLEVRGKPIALKNSQNNGIGLKKWIENVEAWSYNGNTEKLVRQLKSSRPEQQHTSILF